MRWSAVEKLENLYDALVCSRKIGEFLPVKKVYDASNGPGWLFDKQTNTGRFSSD